MAVEKMKADILEVIGDWFEAIGEGSDEVIKEVTAVLDRYEQNNIIQELTVAVNNLDGRLSKIEGALEDLSVPSTDDVVNYMETKGCTQQEAVEALVEASLMRQRRR